MFSTMLLLSLTIGQVIIPPPATSVMSVDSWILWTPPKLNEDGSALTDLKGYLFSVAPDDVDLSTPGSFAIQTMTVEGAELPACPGDTCRFPGARLFEDLTSGDYRIWIQAYDLAGNLSGMTPSPPFPIDMTIPGAPPSVRVEVRVIVEVRIVSP